MNSLLILFIGIVIGPFVWLICFVMFDIVISSYEYTKVKREAVSDRMKELLREFGIMK